MGVLDNNIIFESAVLENAVRDVLGKQEGTVTSEEAKK